MLLTLALRAAPQRLDACRCALDDAALDSHDGPLGASDRKLTVISSPPLSSHFPHKALFYRTIWSLLAFWLWKILLLTVKNLMAPGGPIGLLAQPLRACRCTSQQARCVLGIFAQPLEAVH